MKPMINALEKMLDGPRDNAMLRFSLGNAWLDENADTAVNYYRDALRMDPDYSAAWRALGKALESAERPDEAMEAYRRGISVAENRGDKQAAKEMTVFARRLEKRTRPNS